MSRFVRSIAKLLPVLQQFRGAFTESPKFALHAFINNINYPKDCFRAPSQFLSCLADQILPIFDGRVPSFEFSISCQEQSETMPLVDSILKLPQVKASSYVHFLVYGDNSGIQHSLQINGISNWLHQQIVETPTPPKGYRILKIIEANQFAFLIRLNNVRQLIDTIKAVSESKFQFFLF